MSTIDSLLVVASSAAVRDYWQKTRHPDMGDRALVSLSQKLTFTLAVIAFALGMGILAYDRDEGVFWIIIFGWSGIAATFCPTMILSLFWSGMTALAARCAMVAGFLGVPTFKFLVPWLLLQAGQDDLNQHLTNLDVLAPSFAVSFLVGILVSLMDKSGQQKLEGVTADLTAAKHGPAPASDSAQPPA
jgi:Na+/proline symporter